MGDCGEPWTSELFDESGIPVLGADSAEGIVLQDEKGFLDGPAA